MAIKYQRNNYNPDKLSKHNIDRMAISEVPSNSLVLEVGCATGFIGKYLRKNKKCEVVGVDNRRDEIKVAKINLDKAIQCNIEDSSSIKKILGVTKKRKFDVILAMSLIEHTTNPNKVLLAFKKLLKHNGKIIMTTPNVVHWSVRLNIIKGKFDYTNYGIMDETHLRFLTIKSFKKLFSDSGFNIEKFKIDAEGGGYPRLSLLLAPLFPNLFAYQMLIVASV